MNRAPLLFPSAPTTRRQFLGRLGAGAAVCALGGAAPRLLAAAGPRALVLVQLEGGHDGLATFAPWVDDSHRRLRPSLAAARAELISLDGVTGLHRAGRGLEPLFKEGRLALLPNVGCAGAGPSHYRATEIWHTASEAGEVLGTGWLARCAVQLRAQSRAVIARHGGRALPRVFATEAGPCLATPLAATDPVAQLAEIGAGAGAGGATELYFVSVPGFDTHYDQAPRHAARLQAVADGLADLQRRLARRGVDDRVLTLVFSEFGRSAAENAQGGTDHGGGGPVLLLGRGVRGGLNGDSAATLDFRRVLAMAVDRWLQVPPAAVFGRDFAPLDALA